MFTTLLTNAALAVVSRLMTQKLFEAIITRLLVAAIDKLASMTKTDLVPEVAAEIKSKLVAPKVGQ